MRISSLSKDLTKQSQAKRDDNTTENPDKIIDLSDRQALLDNIKKLTNISDKLQDYEVVGVYDSIIEIEKKCEKTHAT